MHYDIYCAPGFKDTSLVVDRKENKQTLYPGLLIKFAKVLAIWGVIVIVFSYLPAVWYQVVSGGSEKISKLLVKSVEADDKDKNKPVRETKKIDYQPALDERLPYEGVLKIPAIGVDTPLREATLDNYESALKLGVWRVSDFGTPYEREKPTILAAHRYGYLVWSNLYRRRNSFYNLPKLRVGDTVEMDWHQRKYIYAVYAEGSGEEIEDYSADLILYTCETLNSPIRIFKYARLLEI